MNIPFFEALSAGRRVLVAGAGGGFDVVSGVPIALYLRRMGKEVVLANLAFTSLPLTESEEICAGTYRITEQSRDIPYFPEKRIIEWLASRAEPLPMYGFSHDSGVVPLRAAYAEIVKRHQIDTLVLVDGGTDSLIFGDEPGIGTIVEDACSMVAATGVPVERSFLVALGFGIDHFHHVNHHACLENIATLIRDGAYLGAFSLTQEMPEGRAFLELVDYLNQQQKIRQSIVANSIASAIRGEFGDYHATDMTRDSELFINPLMSLYWTFTLQAVVDRMGFASRIEGCESMQQVANAIRVYRALLSQRRVDKSIPL